MYEGGRGERQEEKFQCPRGRHSPVGMEKSVEHQQLKIDDLENCGMCKNLKITNLPEKAEDVTPLVDFLQKSLSTLVGLSADHATLEIECTHRVWLLL